MKKLSNSFLKKPIYSIEIKDKQGSIHHLADPKATRALLALMNMQAVLGGAASHWGGPSAFAEIVSSLMSIIFQDSQKNWYDKYHLINDAGHCENGLYAVKANYNYAKMTFEDLQKFRSIGSPLTGHGEYHLFPEGVYLSNGPLGSTLAQAQGLSVADRLNKNDRMTLVLASDGGLMEGEAKEALASIPGWYSKKHMNPFVLIVSDNNTKLSGRMDEDSFSMQPTFSSLSHLGWEVMTLENPHDLTQTFQTLKKIIDLAHKNPKPILLQAKTIKGYGIKRTQESSSGGHGFPLKKAEEVYDFLREIYQDQEVPKDFLKIADDLVQQKSKPVSSVAPKNKITSISEPCIDEHLSSDLDKNLFSINIEDFSKIKKEKTQVGVAKALIQKRKEGFPILSVSSDLQGSTGVQAFRKEYPQYSFDVGVAESNMISVAAGLSKEGFIPIVDTFAQFAVTKGALPLFMASLSQAPVMAFFSHIGFQDAADGASHQCLTYLAQTGAIPYTKIFTLSCSEEAYSLVGQAVDEFKKEKTNFIFFLGRENFPEKYSSSSSSSSSSSYKLDKYKPIFSNLSKKKKACTILATGTLVEQALQASFKLVEKGWDIILLHSNIINNPDISTLNTCLSKTQRNLITVEDHQIKGGLSSFVSQALLINKISVNLCSLGVQGDFGRSAYTAQDLYKLHSLDTEAIVQKVEKNFQKN